MAPPHRAFTSSRLPVTVPLLIALSLIQYLSFTESVVCFAQGAMLGVALLETIRRYQAEHQLRSITASATSSRIREDEKPKQPIDRPQCVVEQKPEHKSSSESVRRFLSTISHEIRTSLNGIIGLGTLLADTPLNTDQLDLLKSLRECSDGLLLIVNDVLDFSKIDAGKLDLDIRPFDLVACLQSACHLLDLNASPKGIQMTQSIAEGTPKYVVGDANRLRQVLINLLGNAVKFTDKGGVHVRVKGEDVTNAEGVITHVKVQFEVEDTGIGIHPESMEGLFQSFSQIHSTEKRCYGGTGLGLAISKRLVELMDEKDGRMWATSCYGKGSTFYVSLSMPVCTQEATMSANAGLKKTEAYSWLNAENAEKQGALPIAPAADCSPGAYKTLAERVPIRILVAEDNLVNQKLSLRLLQKLGYNSDYVDLVEDGREAVNAIVAKPYDLILMDIQMPHMSGLEATRAIRADPSVAQRGLQPVILALTANAMETDRNSCLDAGMNGHVSKPVKLETLANVIELHGADLMATKLSSKVPDPSNIASVTTAGVTSSNNSSTVSSSCDGSSLAVAAYSSPCLPIRSDWRPTINSGLQATSAAAAALRQRPRLKHSRSTDSSRSSSESRIGRFSNVSTPRDFSPSAPISRSATPPVPGNDSGSSSIQPLPPDRVVDIPLSNCSSGSINNNIPTRQQQPQHSSPLATYVSV
ncbi:hypothetical protein PhCBS80983_g06228 [Powellomyces hirtus]|uniref:Histidine kinase n=1 Tax=Powellomyces hirtus TaxID=109895 RepID=A0A507DQ17_9FUNG|nr:hypothetical protein PhCBS80983_g06228 [Powellomyces hirtus]